METIIKYIWLTTKGLSPRKLSKLLEIFPSIEEIYIYNDYEQIIFLNQKERDLLLDKSLVKAENIYNKCVEKGISIITIDDSNYPQILKEISKTKIISIKNALNARQL